MYEWIAVILTYRNGKELEQCIISLKNKLTNLHIIIVNAYYDKKSEEYIHSIASKHKCDYIGIMNKGYSYGNNKGIEYANQNYEYKYIIVANPDTELVKFSKMVIDKNKSCVIGPQIVNLNGKNQNPLLFRRNRLSETLFYYGYLKDNSILRLFASIINRANREMVLLIMKMKNKHIYSVYALHGSFVIFPKSVISTIGLPYDDRIFLFSEEIVLAEKLKKNDIKNVVCNELTVQHKENNSMKFVENRKMYDYSKQATIFIYTHYLHKQGE